RYSRRECESLRHLLSTGPGRPSSRRHRNARARGESGDITLHQSALQADPELRNQLRRQLQDFLPELALPAWEDERVGLLTFSMDGEPILGPIQQLPGLYVAVAFHSG